MKDTKQKKQQVTELLRLHYGFTAFRPGQEAVIDSVLSGKSTLVIMPTGGGKSLCFQLPALVLEGVTIVISPLISLMKDQVDALEKIGIPATFINSSISAAETAARINSVKSGAYKLLYIAPERFYSREFMEALKTIKVSLFAIDEAHCISQWGHDFRPSYMRLKNTVEALGNPPVIALTATATPEVKEDIIRQLDLKNPEVIVTGFGRPNLRFSVIQARENEKNRIALEAALSAPESCGIIYASTRARVDNLLQYFLENNIEAATYHAGMDPGDRKWVQDNFLSGKIKTIIATNAFGLGIDKPDVRYVIHYDMPGTVEAYYQEAGRAGRDGKPAFCLMIFNSRDRALHEFFIKGDNPPPNVVKELYETLLNYESDSVMITYSELSDMISDKVPDMAIGTALKILEKEAYIMRSREKSGQAFLRLNKKIDLILETIGTRAKKQREAFLALSERYGEKLQKGLELNLEEAGELIGFSKASLTRLIKKLLESESAEYRPPFKGTEIKILQRIDPEELKIDSVAMKEKLEKSYAKLEQIEEYAYTFDCRQKFILDYFGDSEAKNCGTCDSCLTFSGELKRNGQDLRTLPPKPEKNEIDFEIKAPSKKSELGTKLTQLETFELFRQGLTIEKIMEERKFDRSELFSHFAYLIKNELLTKEEVRELIPKPIRKKIILSVEECGSDKPEKVYKALKGEISLDEIKIILDL